MGISTKTCLNLFYALYCCGFSLCTKCLSSKSRIFNISDSGIKQLFVFYVYAYSLQ